MPTVKELEEELAAEIDFKKSPLDEKREKLMALIKANAKDEVKIPKSEEKIKEIIDNVFFPLNEIINTKIDKQGIKSWYVNTRTLFRLDNYGSEKEDEFMKLLDENKNPRKLEFDIYFDGFKKAGTNAFGNDLRYTIQFSEFKYTLRFDKNDNPNKEFLYSHELSNKELDNIAEILLGTLMDIIIIEAERNLKQ